MFWRLSGIYSVLSFFIEKIRSVPQILSIWEQKKPEYAGTDLQMHAIVLSKDENTKFFWYFSKSFVSDETNLGTLINQTLSESRLETPPSSGVSWLKWKVVLNLKNLSVADSGSYWCQAENIVGTVKRQTPLNVTTRPITPSPSGRKWLSKHAEANGLCYFRNPLQTIC